MATITARAPTSLYADRVGLLGTEQAFALAALIREAEERGQDVIRCNLGSARTSPCPRTSGERSGRRVEDGYTTYCDAQGLLELRRAVARDVAARRGCPRSTRTGWSIYPGARAPIGFAQQTYCQPGDEVVYPTPGYPLFESFIGYVGAVPRPIRLREDAGFAFDRRRPGAGGERPDEAGVPQLPVQSHRRRRHAGAAGFVAGVLRPLAEQACACTPTSRTSAIVFDGAGAPLHRLAAGHGGVHDHRLGGEQDLRVDGRPGGLGRVPDRGGGRFTGT